MLTLKEIRRKVIEIKKLVTEADNEVAHGEEDRLHQLVLQAIANGTCEHPALAARVALLTKKIHFDRWYG